MNDVDIKFCHTFRSAEWHFRMRLSQRPAAERVTVLVSTLRDAKYAPQLQPFAPLCHTKHWLYNQSDHDF
jgi:hypothetical protein